jgi:uncharacterized protein YkwD
MDVLTKPNLRALLAALFIVVLAIAGCETGGGPDPDPDPDPDTNTAASMRARINDFREDSGLDALTNDTTLAEVAQAQAEHNAGNSTNSDSNSSGETIAEQLTAEGYAFTTVAYLFNNLSESTSFNEWKTNATYSGIMLDPAYTDFGVGTDTQTNGTRRWVVVFAAKDAPTSNTVTEMLNLLNEFRDSESAGTLTLNDNLSIVAQAQAEHNASVEKNEAATGGEGIELQVADTGYTYGTLMWTLSSGGAASSVDRWTDTQDEHDLMLDPRFADVGIGVAVGGTKQWWVVIYAEPVTPTP